jgi:tRNA(Ile)-lysidine synthase
VAPGQVPAAEPRRIAAPGITRWEPAGIWVTARAPGLEPPAGTADPPGQIAFELTGAWNPPTPDDAALLVPPGGHADRCHLAVADDGPWWLRHRRAGDRIRTAVGTARIAAVMVDAGMPRAVRERWPVVTDADDVVVWVPGIAVDAAVLTAGRADPAVQLVVGPAGADVVGPAGADVVGGVAGPV